MRAAGEEQVPNRPVRLWHAGVMVILVAVALVFSGFIYTNRAVSRSDQQWCGLLVLLDDSNQARDRSTLNEDQRRFVDTLHDIRLSKHC